MTTFTPAEPLAGRIDQGGRSKAYRPLGLDDRRAAFAAGLAAFERGAFFEAHEVLEPAWMGTADLTERELHQGLIKLAAAYVHAVRGNRAGVVKNLAGARARLAIAIADPIGLAAVLDSLGAGGAGGAAIEELPAAIDERLAALDAADALDAGAGAAGLLGLVPPPRIGRQRGRTMEDRA